MGRIRNILRKTPLRYVWRKTKSIPAVKATASAVKEKYHDHILDKTYPELYNSLIDQPVDENKILFIEPRLDVISNSFQLIYDTLSNTTDFTIHVHYLRNSYVSNHQYVKNCKAMIRDLATAKYVFVNDASPVIGCLQVRPETVITQLWHACGAFKKFGMSTAEKIFGLNAEQQHRHPNYRNLTYVTLSSPEIAWAYEEAMDLQDHPEIFKAVGTSRTDVFFDETFRARAFDHLYEQFPAARGKKIILFAPTFRGRAKKPHTCKCFDYQAFFDALGEEYVVVAKHHPWVRHLPEIPEELNGSFAIDLTRTMSIEDLICVSDICISDYSSLIFEYSLFERPMLFFAYDLEEYFDWRGFYYPYEELTPGPICRTNEEMIDYILHIDERFDKKVVADFRDKFMSACDGHATERILELTMGKEQLEKHRKTSSQ